VLPPIARQTYSRTHCGPDEPRDSSGRWGTRHHIVAIPLAAGLLAPWGFVLSPAVGAVLMSASTVIVAINAQLLRRAKLS